MTIKKNNRIKPFVTWNLPKFDAEDVLRIWQSDIAPPRSTNCWVGVVWNGRANTTRIQDYQYAPLEEPHNQSKSTQYAIDPITQ